MFYRFLCLEKLGKLLVIEKIEEKKNNDNIIKKQQKYNIKN